MGLHTFVSANIWASKQDNHGSSLKCKCSCVTSDLGLHCAMMPVFLK